MRVVTALVHHPPKIFERRPEILRRPDHTFQQLLEAPFRQQADILGEHGEQAAHEKFGDFLGVVLSFQAAGDIREPLGNVAGDLGAAFGGIERMRIGPDRAQPGADFGLAQAGQRNGIAGAVGELGVILPLPGEIGIHLDDIADIDDQNEGRPAMLLGQGAGVILGLLLGLAHGLVPAARTAGRRAGLDLRGVLGEQGRLGRIGRLPLHLLGGLLAFHDKAIALVQVDPAPRRRAVVELEVDAPFEDVIVVFVDFLRRVGPRQAEQIAQFVGEHLEVRRFRAAGLFPAGDKRLDGGGVRLVSGRRRLCVRFAHGAKIAKAAFGESPRLQRPPPRRRTRRKGCWAARQFTLSRAVPSPVCRA